MACCVRDALRWWLRPDGWLQVYGECKPYAITGSLPCIKELQDEGYDVQTLGFGKMSTHHALNE